MWGEVWSLWAKDELNHPQLFPSQVIYTIAVFWKVIRDINVCQLKTFVTGVQDIFESNMML